MNYIDVIGLFLAVILFAVGVATGCIVVSVLRGDEKGGGR